MKYDRQGVTTVRLVRRGEQHPYIVAVTTPGWQGIDYLDSEIEMPGDLQAICDLLKEVGARYYDLKGEKEGVILFMNDGDAEFVFHDAENFARAVDALTRAGWLWPKPAGGVQ